MDARLIVEKIITSRRGLIPAEGFTLSHNEAAEGGCGVIGLASNVQVASEHLLQALRTVVDGLNRDLLAGADLVVAVGDDPIADRQPVDDLHFAGSTGADAHLAPLGDVPLTHDHHEMVPSPVQQGGFGHNDGFARIA